MSGCAVETTPCSDVQLKQKITAEGSISTASEQPSLALSSKQHATSLAPSTKQPVTVRTPQIHWHGKSPVFAIDFHPHFPRLCATGGSEPDGTGGIHLWLLNDGENAVEVSIHFHPKSF